LCFPIVKLIENIVKTLTRLEIIIFIVNINVVLLVAQRKDGFIASLTSITVFSCAHIKSVLRVFYPSASLLRR